jgi:hypothetical protein
MSCSDASTFKGKVIYYYTGKNYAFSGKDNYNQTVKFNLFQNIPQMPKTVNGKKLPLDRERDRLTKVNNIAQLVGYSAKREEALLNWDTKFHERKTTFYFRGSRMAIDLTNEGIGLCLGTLYRHGFTWFFQCQDGSKAKGSNFGASISAYEAKGYDDKKNVISFTLHSTTVKQ